MIVADGLPIADCAPDWCEDDTPEPNARRIVACVNACAGIPTALLEHGAMAFQGQVVLVVSGELSEMERHALRTAPPGSIVAIPSGTKIKIVGHPIPENPTMESM